MKENLKTCSKVHSTSNNLSINDLCIVSNDQNEYYRGQIVSIVGNTYNVKCIDYGNILQNLTVDHLYVLPDAEIFNSAPLARKCQLYGVDDINQSKAIEEVIKNIPLTEYVTVIIENGDDRYIFVTLIRENNEIVNDRYQSNNNNIQGNNQKKSDNDKNLTLTIGIPPGESTYQDNDTINSTGNISLLSTSNNQTIDYGEDDLSTRSTTIKYETNNSKKKTN